MCINYYCWLINQSCDYTNYLNGCGFILAALHWQEEGGCGVVPASLEAEQTTELNSMHVCLERLCVNFSYYIRLTPTFNNLHDAVVVSCRCEMEFKTVNMNVHVR